jgi:hypothetical protein
VQSGISGFLKGKTKIKLSKLKSFIPANSNKELPPIFLGKAKVKEFAKYKNFENQFQA